MTIPTEESGWDRRRSLLQANYEQIAWTALCRAWLREVTVDEIAEAAGVSARTLFRYFPSKEDFLLGFTRRGLQALVDSIAELEPSPAPLRTVWQLIREHSSRKPPGRPSAHAVATGGRRRSGDSCPCPRRAGARPHRGGRWVLRQVDGDSRLGRSRSPASGRRGGRGRDGGHRDVGPVEARPPGDPRGGGGGRSRIDPQETARIAVTRLNRKALAELPVRHRLSEHDDSSAGGGSLFREARHAARGRPADLGR